MAGEVTQTFNNTIMGYIRTSYGRTTYDEDYKTKNTENFIDKSFISHLLKKGEGVLVNSGGNEWKRPTNEAGTFYAELADEIKDDGNFNSVQIYFLYLFLNSKYKTQKNVLENVQYINGYKLEKKDIKKCANIPLDKLDSCPHFGNIYYLPCIIKDENILYLGSYFAFNKSEENKYVENKEILVSKMPYSHLINGKHHNFPENNIVVVKDNPSYTTRASRTNTYGNYESLPDEVKINGIFIGFKVWYTGSTVKQKNTKLEDIIKDENANASIKWISLLFMKEQVVYELRKEINRNGKKYIIPTIASWNNKESKYPIKSVFRVAFEYAYNKQNLKANIIQSKDKQNYKLAVETCFIGNNYVGSGSENKIITPEALKDKILYICSDELPVVKERSATWADQYDNDIPVPFLHYDDRGTGLIEYNVTFIDNNGKQLTETTASAVAKYSPIFSKTISQIFDPWERIDSEWKNYERLEGEEKVSNCNFDLEITSGEVSKGTELYKAFFTQAVSNSCDCEIVDNNIIFHSPNGEIESPQWNREPDNNQADYKNIKDLILVDDNVQTNIYNFESGGKDKYPKIKYKNGDTAAFFTDSTGVCTVGHGHTFGSPITAGVKPYHTKIWNLFSEFIREEGYKLVEDSSTTKDLKEKYKTKTLVCCNGQYILINEKGIFNQTIPNSSGSEEQKMLYRVSEKIAERLEIEENKAITEDKVFELVQSDLEGKTPSLFSWIKKREKDTITEGINTWRKGNYRKNYTISKGITQEQWDFLLDMFYQGVPAPFQNSNFPLNLDSYEDFCAQVVKSIDEVEKLGKSWLLRNKKNRDAMRKAFTVSGMKTPIEPVKGEVASGGVKKVIVRAIAKTKFEITSVMKEETKNNIWSQFLKDSNNGNGGVAGANNCKVYYVKKLEEPKDKNDNDNDGGGENQEQENTAEGFKRAEALINKWRTRPSTAEKAAESTPQKLLDVDLYYDMFSGMTPLIQVGLKVEENRAIVLDNIMTPYVKDFRMEDNGVKKVCVHLYDKDFGSYQAAGSNFYYWSLGNDGKADGNWDRIDSNQTHSLEQIILCALRNAKKLDDQEELEPYNGPFLKDKGTQSNQAPEDMLQMVEEQNSKNKFSNLYIRFGYMDDNPNPGTITQYFEKKGAKLTGRERRWFDDNEIFGMGSYGAVADNPPSDGGSSGGATGGSNGSGDDDKTIKDASAGYTDQDIFGTEPVDMTTSVSRITSYMILGYKSTLKRNGIEYEITGIENSYVSLKKKTFLQRYAEITSYPLEVLYILMRMFNENEQGQKLKTGVKIYFHDDKDKGEPAKGMNMLFCFDGMSDEQMQDACEEIKSGEIRDYYTAVQKGIEVDKRLLKKITLSLGNEDAEKRNYENSVIWKKTRDIPGAKPRPAVKDVEQLIQDFCAACPPRIEYSKNNEGNYEAGKTYPLTYFVGTYPGDEENVCIVLYYRKPKRFNFIRNYRYGPQLGYKTNVLECTIENSNEFALLSGVMGLQPGPNGLMANVRLNTKGADAGVVDEGEDAEGLYSKYEQGEGLLANFAGSGNINALYDEAYASCMYKGTLRLLGDPGLEFTSILQPFTYPIRLEYILPQNESEVRAKNVQTLDIPDGEEPYSKRYNMEHQQKFHSSTGYYVITKITHEITSSGFTTTLDIVRYPGIEKEVLRDTKNPLEHVPSKSLS